MFCVTTLIMLALVVLILMTTCDAYGFDPVVIWKKYRPSSRSPDYIPAPHFKGCMVDYVFTTRNGALGYHKDEPPFAKDVNKCTNAEPIVTDQPFWGSTRPCRMIQMGRKTKKRQNDEYDQLVIRHGRFTMTAIQVHHRKRSSLRNQPFETQNGLSVR